jgi:O-antigen/teichoic acid export membrane protein
MSSNDKVLDNLAVGAGQGLAGAFLGRILGLLGDVFAARFLGPALFGLYITGWALLRFFSLIAPFGLEKGVLRFSAKYLDADPAAHKGLLLQSIGLSSLSGATFGALLFLLAPWLAEAYQKPELEIVFRAFAFAFPPMTVLIVIAAATRSTKRVAYAVLIQDVGQPLLGLLLMVLFYSLGLSLIGIVLSDAVSLTVTAAVGLIVLGKLFSKSFRREVRAVLPGRELLKFSATASFASAFVVYIFWVDRLLVSYFLTAFDIGIYQAASQISALFAVALAGINLVVIPMFADAHHRNDRGALQEIYTVATKWGVYFCVPALVVLFVSPGESLELFFGPEYRSGAGALLVLLAGQTLNLLTGAVNPLIVMTGNQKTLFRLSSLALGFAVASNLILIPRFGLVGAAVSTALSMGGLFGLAVIWARKNLGLWPYDRRYIKGLTSCALAALGVLAVKGRVEPVALDLILQGAAAVAIFVVALYLQKPDEEDRVFVSVVFSRLSLRR